MLYKVTVECVIKNERNVILKRIHFHKLLLSLNFVRCTLLACTLLVGGVPIDNRRRAGPADLPARSRSLQRARVLGRGFPATVNAKIFFLLVNDDCHENDSHFE